MGKQKKNKKIEKKKATEVFTVDDETPLLPTKKANEIRETDGISILEKVKAYRYMFLPILFSISMWIIMLCPQRAMDAIPMKQISFHNVKQSNELCLAPKNLFDSFLLGEIAAKLEETESLSPEEVSSVLDQAREILNVQDRNLTMVDITEGVPKAIQMKEKQVGILQKIRGVFSFIGVLSLISIIGIFATFLPVMVKVVKVLRLDVFWAYIVTTFHWIKDLIMKVLDPILYSAAILIVIESLYYPTQGARAQIAIFAAGFVMMVFFVRTLRFFARTMRGTLHHEYKEPSALVIFAWLWSYLTPMALCADSRVLGFFSIGSVFGALGFVAFPMPYGWAAGFLEAPMDRCIVVSLVIMTAALGAKGNVYPISEEIKHIFEVGASVFGMLSFGIAGIIKSSDMVWSGRDSSTNPKSFIYPVAWLALAFLGSITSYASLTNTSITFVVLWITQFYWRLAGLTAVTVFLSSCTLFGVTLWLKDHPDFLVSLFQI